MNPHVRSSEAPRFIVAGWAVSAICGALLILQPSGDDPVDGLAPATLARYLTTAAGEHAQDIRVNGTYGSGHAGAWQFIAHITWRNRMGDIRGGTVTLPQSAGQPAIMSQFDTARLEAEEMIGWTLARLDTALRDMPAADDQIALIDLEIPPDGGATLVTCHSAKEGPAACQQTGPHGDRAHEFRDVLSDESTEGALGVQRRGALLESSRMTGSDRRLRASSMGAVPPGAAASGPRPGVRVRVSRRRVARKVRT